MAKNVLPTNFQDDILGADMNGRRRYKMIQNADGTVSLEDASAYDQVGSNFGAGQINATNTAVNASADAGKIIDNTDDIMANTQKGMMAGALALKEVNSNLGGLRFSIDADGNYGYIKDGADTVTPFRGKIVIPYLYIWSENLNSPQTHQAALQIKVTGYTQFSFDHFSIGTASMGAPILEIKGDSTQLFKLGGASCGYKEFDISAYDTITVSLLDRMYKSQTAGLYDLIIS